MVNGSAFTVSFRGVPPAGLKVGDELQIRGLVTVRSIGAELIDVSSGIDKRYLPGEITIDLYSNDIEVAAP